MNDNDNYMITKEEFVFLEIIQFLLKKSPPTFYTHQSIGFDYYELGVEGCFYSDDKVMKYICLRDHVKGIMTKYDENCFSNHFNQIVDTLIKDPSQNMPHFKLVDNSSPLSVGQKLRLNHVAKRIVLLRDL